MEHIFAPALRDKIADNAQSEINALFEHLDKAINTESLKQSLYQVVKNAVFLASSTHQPSAIVLPDREFVSSLEDPLSEEKTV